MFFVFVRNPFVTYFVCFSYVFRIISCSSARYSKKIAKTYVLSLVLVDKHFLHPTLWLHATCLDHSNVRRVRFQQWCQSMSISYYFVLFFVFSYHFNLISMYFVCFSYLHMFLSYCISYVFCMCFVLFRILQHDIRRKSPKRMCYHRFSLTNTFCIQHHGCMLLAWIISS